MLQRIPENRRVLYENNTKWFIPNTARSRDTMSTTDSQNSNPNLNYGAFKNRLSENELEGLKAKKLNLPSPHKNWMEEPLWEKKSLEEMKVAERCLTQVFMDKSSPSTASDIAEPQSTVTLKV